MDLKKSFWIVFKCFWIVSAALFITQPFITQSSSAEIMEFRVSQVFQHLPKITVYLHLNQESGKPIENIEGVKFSAFVDADSAALTSTSKFDADNDGAAYLFLVDVSKSLNAAQFGQIKEALSTWVKAIKEKDKAALMTFGTAVRTVQDFTADKELLIKAVNELALTDMNTQLHLGLARAIELCRRKDADLPGRRAVITLSDGQDDFAGGMTKNEVLNQLKDDPIPIYAIGFAKPPVTQEKESYLKTLGEFARTSGGLYFNSANSGNTINVDNTPLSEIYGKVRQSVLDVWAAQLDCKDCPADGGVHRLQMSMESGSRTITDGQNIRLLPITPAVEETTPVTPAIEESTTESPQEAATPQAEPAQTATPQPEPAQTATPQPEPAQAATPQAEPAQAATPQPEPAQTAKPQPEPAQAATPQAEPAFWQKIPIWAWLAAAILLLAPFILISFFKKKNNALQNQLNSHIQANQPEQMPAIQSTATSLEQPFDSIAQELAASPPEQQSAYFEPTKTATIINNPPAIPIKLTILGGSKPGSYSHNLVDTLIIGRSKHCDIAITDDDQISSRHCELIQRDKGVYLKDLGSTNGTMVNGVPFNGMNYLHNGDLILVGRTELRITYKKG
ncbi:MAG: VWA domain-containing protein [Desulfamplus sp.]|nr:VWA domain-containing protein [Desulfamplus sp.]